MMRILTWKVCFDSEISEQAIRGLFPDGKRFRVSASRYPAHTAFSGARRIGHCFVIGGTVEFCFDNDTPIVLHAGEFGVLPEGRYHFHAIGDTDVYLVSVWDIGAFFERQQTDLEQKSKTQGVS